ncbi:hypothetical protein MUO32_20075 [Shinella sp. CPCC 101442]|uniref:hypothetical protein n=1 Tax=Shinella sp. CPCC 101442 TaxID=2932265 RepID=UPI002153405A|nr:hypothetical protein [Shinella sp. CPCC 101442]MCR6501336.1 hypothetical protein [Shinella sp. CPCC 101442]
MKATAVLAYLAIPLAAYTHCISLFSLPGNFSKRLIEFRNFPMVYNKSSRKIEKSL